LLTWETVAAWSVSERRPNGKSQIEYLMVRKDLLAAGKIDGSAHLVGNRGLVFLFNSGQTKLSGQFALTEDRVGLKGKGNFQVSQEYPAFDRKIVSASGETVRWEVPAESAIVLRIQPAQCVGLTVNRLWDMFVRMSHRLSRFFSSPETSFFSRLRKTLCLNLYACRPRIRGST
jgi:hypothetical protein